MKKNFLILIFFTAQASHPPTIQKEVPSLQKLVINKLAEHVVLKKEASYNDLKTFLEKNISISQQLETPLKIACAELMAKQLGITISSIDYENVDRKKNSLLHHAAIQDNRWFVQLLLQMQLVQIDKQNQFGNTALHCAINKRADTVVPLLVSSGASIYRKNATKASPILCAAERGSIQTIDLLLVKDPRLLHECDRSGNNLLHISIFEKNVPIATYLAKKMQINAQNANGETPLHFAALINNTKLAQMLLRFGACKTKLDNCGNLAYTFTTDDSLAQLLRPGAINELFAQIKSYLMCLG